MGLIYRVERFDGTGPYVGQHELPEKILPSGFTNEHPDPSDDSLLVDRINMQIRREAEDDEHYRPVSMFSFIMDRGYFFGFNSQDQLRRWFYADEWLVKLDQNGFNLSVYEVPPQYVFVGHTQAVFLREKATQKYRVDLCDFFAIPTE